MTVYERIRNLREDRDLKQKDLAGLLSIGQTTYSDYELGKLGVPISVLVQLAEYYGTSIDYLVGLADVETPYPRRKQRE
ncbi:helix-turn-helix domain-containing protein [Caproiciproducens sp. R1]|uniref:helix-turn-helix domain-containing protein n=1 Tax=Caproiciproducens sp. R1 TaxID=3435000 RepID=UPI00403420AD